jgi:serine/threonine protein kinase
MFHEMLTGSRPYSAESLDLLLARHLTAPVPQLPAEFGGLQAILDKLMAKAPEDRHPSARALLDQLAELPLLRTTPSGRGGSSAV